MNSVLQQLYYGGLCPHRDARKTPPDCPTSYETIRHQQERFRAALQERAPELTAKFDVLASDTLHVLIDDTEEMFSCGFGLAVKLLAEGLAD